MRIEYIAGFVDGEGSLCTGAGGAYRYKGKARRPTYRPQITVMQTHHEVLAKIREYFGNAGGIFKRKKTKAHHKDSWAWTVTGHKQCAPILRELIPHLIVKREVAEELLRFCEHRLEQKTRPFTQVDADYINRIRALNDQRGGQRRETHPLGVQFLQGDNS